MKKAEIVQRKKATVWFLELRRKKIHHQIAAFVQDDSTLLFCDQRNDTDDPWHRTDSDCCGLLR